MIDFQAIFIDGVKVYNSYTTPPTTHLYLYISYILEEEIPMIP